jgi:hypothetical protein
MVTVRAATLGCVSTRRLRDAGQQIGPAVEVMVAELDPPPSDAPLLALVRRQARVIDAMPDAVAVSMLPNHTGQLLKALGELEDRARRRRASRPGAPNPVRELRAEWAGRGRGRAG